MLVIHPGYPKTGTTFLQQLVLQENWYFGAGKTDELSTSLSESVRGTGTARDLAETVRTIAGHSIKHSVLMSEEAVLSPRPYEVASKIGLYPRIDRRVVEDGAMHEPTHKLLSIAGAVQGTNHAWLLTVRKHPDWCRSYYRYTLSELGPKRAGVYLQALAAARSVGGALYSPTIRLIRALDPDSPIHVVPMEALTNSSYQAECTRIFASLFGLDVPLTSGSSKVNASASPLPATYTRFVQRMTHMSIPRPLRRVARNGEKIVRGLIKGKDRSAVFEAEIAQLEDAFREDTAVLQSFSQFNLRALGYIA